MIFVAPEERNLELIRITRSNWRQLQVVLFGESLENLLPSIRSSRTPDLSIIFNPSSPSQSRE